MDSPSKPTFPDVLRRDRTDEYVPQPASPEHKRAVEMGRERSAQDAKRAGFSLRDYCSGRLGTAAGLLELNEAFGVRYFDVSEEARFDQDAANAAFDGTDVVIDVHTHFMAQRTALDPTAMAMIKLWRDQGPEWCIPDDDADAASLSLANYLSCIFLRSETAIAVLTSPPSDTDGVDFLTNAELAGTREMFDRLAGTGRLLNHCVVHPTDPGVLDSMERWSSELRPAGWKVYTLGHRAMMDAEAPWDAASSWMLDDEDNGLPFLEKSRALGITNICAHKGLSVLSESGSPRDIGPCAKLFPELRFLVYHSGYETELEEGPYSEETGDIGVNRLIQSMRDSGVAPGSNVYADLGSTWYCLMKRPLEAAHVLGKLLLDVGEDNVLWGTDGIFYGPTQPQIDSFRSFQIPDELCARYGYPKLTTTIRNKILGQNAAPVYGLNLEDIRATVKADKLDWVPVGLSEYAGQGTPTHRWIDSSIT